MMEVSTHEKVKHGSASMCWLSREPATAPMAAAVANDPIAKFLVEYGNKPEKAMSNFVPVNHLNTCQKANSNFAPVNHLKMYTNQY